MFAWAIRAGAFVVEGEGERRAYAPLSGSERALFLEVLSRTGNRRAAAEAIGVEPRLMDQRREADAELDRDWAVAVEEADRDLAGVQGAFEGVRAQGLDAIRRGRNGRLQMVAAGEARWTAEIEARFLDLLRATGNVRASAQAVGSCESTVWTRRRQWLAFAEAMENVLEEAELSLEYRIACMGGDLLAQDEGEETRPSTLRPGSGQASLGTNGERGAASGPQPVPFDPDFALRFLKWREEKRRGGGRRTRRAREPTIEEVDEEIVRRVAAIKRHREREGKGGEA